MLEIIRKNKSLKSGDKTIESDSQTLVLGTSNQFREKVRDHFFRNAELHFHVAKSDITPEIT